MSKYIDIANDLKKKIQAGTYAPGEPLPGQKNLADEYKTSRMTIQKSLSLLKAEGYLYSQQGSATYVKNNIDSLANLDIGVDQYVGISKLMEGKHKVTSKVLKFEIRYPEETERDKLSLGPTDAVYDILRLRLVDQAPYSIEHTIMPISIIPGLSDDILSKSVYHYIQESLGLEVGGAYRQFSAKKSSEDDIKFLGNESTDPVLVITNVVYLENGTPFEYSIVDQKYDKGRFGIFVPSQGKF
ncbi:GntR family transcriptional regulator [Lacticaseibacillus hegangensis]|uniref:GntR family transcriptional regulator n=1 Tax=Lacticaseibacillus hegangensis TaxID=2486010 RepID=A0ABW4CZ08_9LACO|nr:GntR family transcriptional regulator [Lacticaseibacillus hegangensis]